MTLTAPLFAALLGVILFRMGNVYSAIGGKNKVGVKLGTQKSHYPRIITNYLPHFIGGSIGLDLEWGENGKPSIIGVAGKRGDGWRGYSVPWECDMYGDNTVERLMQILGSVDEIVGHSIITSDVPALQQHLPFPIIPPKQFDTLIYFYLTNAHLCKARAEKPHETSKFSPSERTVFEQESKGGGFMSLWTMASLYTDLPNWKECHGEKCNSFEHEYPCYAHAPFQYNGIDALAPLMARDALEREAKLKRVDHLVPLLSRVSRIAANMSANGVCVDEDWLGKLELKMEQQKTLIKDDLPPEVNWQSPQQIIKFFKDKYGLTPASTSEEDIEQFYEDHGFDEAGTLLELKQAGRGLKSWFDRRFIKDGYLHPRFIPVGGTATGRWASARPNFQSIPVRRAADVRKIIIARPGYELFSADYKQAEGRVVFKLAGYDVPADGSFKQWLLATLQLDPTDAGVRHLGGEWNAAKSILHAGNYGEGLTFLTVAQLNTPYYTNLIAKGALEVYPGWKYDGKIVCCTGVNMAARMFGRATHENRKKALELRRRYFQKFPGVLEWQKSVSQQVEKQGYVQSAFGFYLTLYGEAFSKLKTALAMLGSNPVAYYTNHALCNADDDGAIPVAQVHDELLWEMPLGTSDAVAIEKVVGWQEISREEMEGLKLPVEISRGSNWGEQEGIYG